MSIFDRLRLKNHTHTRVPCLNFFSKKGIVHVGKSKISRSNASILPRFFFKIEMRDCVIDDDDETRGLTVVFTAMIFLTRRVALPSVCVPAMGAREVHGEMAVAVLGEIRRGDVQVLRVSVAGLEGDAV